ncbi:MAG: hypothetical protein AB7S26_27775 [Sandaracinaceae bacterium]
MRTRTISLAALLLLAAPASPSLAQGGVAGSGMGQGEARISARSDVRLSMESMPGTSGATVSALGTRVGARMAQIRACYEEVIAERPTVTGRLRLRLNLPERGRADVTVADDGVGDRGLVSCVTRQLQQVDCDRISRPAGAIVQLEMQNTAAAGVAESARRTEEHRQVDVHVDDEGNATATGGSPERGVRYTVTARGAHASETASAAHRALASALPGLTDCRRRAGRRGQDPSGEISAQMQVRTGRAPTSRVTRSTVADDRTGSCVERVLRRISLRATEGSGSVEARITYSRDVD